VLVLSVDIGMARALGNLTGNCVATPSSWPHGKAISIAPWRSGFSMAKNWWI
jgi:hypothetical protein